MGTRADFYVGRGKDAEWIGSIAWDGYPDGITPNDAEMEPLYRGGPMRHKDAEWPTGAHLFDAATEAEYRQRVERFFQHRDDVTRPADGWPWPWETSRLTDYAYAFDGGTVYATDGRSWWPAHEEEPDEDADGGVEFPDMSARKATTYGPRSGLIVFGA
jgi:hypothetical protein